MAKRISKENKWGDKSRFYEVKGKRYPSVTTILGCIGKPALIAWSAKVEREMVIEASSNLYLDVQKTAKMSEIGWRTALADRLGKMKASQKELAKASEIGSQAHAWIEWDIKRQLMHDVGLAPVISPPAMHAVGAWERWKNSVDFKPLLCEQAVWSDYWEYAGTMDLLAEVNGEVTLLDWKTGKAVYREAHLQNAAYRYAVHEMGLLPDDRHGDQPSIAGMIVRLPKVETDPEFEVVKIEEPENTLFSTFIHTLELWKWLNAKEELTDSLPETPKEGPTETENGAGFPAVPAPQD